MRYRIPAKDIDRIIEIEGYPKFELPKISFAQKMDFLKWLEDVKAENPQVILEKVIRDALPKELADAVMGSENMIFISEIYAQIVACQLGMSVEEYLKESDKLTKKK